MKNMKDFKSKFELLNSQQYPEEIIWSSDSSDYENTFFEGSKSAKLCHRKRKRKSNSNFFTNIPNLDVTISDSSQEQTISNCRKSPVLIPKRLITDFGVKPVPNDQYISSKIKATTTVPTSSMKSQRNESKSPVLSPKVSKKLLETNCAVRKRSPSPVLNTNHCKLIKIQHGNFSTRNDVTKSELKCHKDIIRDEFCAVNKNVDIIKKVKTYFSNSCSQSSNHSIVEYDSSPRESLKTSEELEIAELSQPLQMNKEILSMSSMNSDYRLDKSKRMRYKRDGLAYRLSVLLKKQNASVSLWQHERYLAENSNFIIPRGHFLNLRIRKFEFKFGIVSLDSVDSNNEEYLVIINSDYVKNNCIKPNCVLKLYEPYKIVETKNCKLILNVCKFDCTSLKI
ncbi:uncharacterized protein LOC126973325 [Leptidea sinapis]|uniref:uncharacterized protein LOC126973325 n=1 Tax=Leptidea sinapis TaxID=189913 RepID=UPI002124F7B3|nr:uncharacterized protein LOC126973325 [Leptidea sinapis]